MIWRFAKNAFTVLALIALMGVSGLAIVTKIHGGSLLSVQTKSMVPVLNKGDLVSAQRVPAEQLKLGDIITFVNPKNKKTTITHRLVQLPSVKNGKMFVTRGDANPTSDTPIEGTAILGRMRYSLPYLGYGADFIRQPLGLLLVIYIPALGVIIGEMRRLSAYYKSQQPYTASGRKSKLISFETKRSRNLTTAKFLPLLLLIPLILAAPVYAALKTQVKLTGNIIKATRPSTTNTCTNTTNNNNININSTTTQTGTTGNVTNTNNTSTGSSTSGEVNNSNNTNINITITNC